MTEDEEDRIVLKGCYLAFGLWFLGALILFKAFLAAAFGVPFFSFP